MHVGVLLPQVANSKYSKLFHRSFINKLESLYGDSFGLQVSIVFCGKGELGKVVDAVNQLIDFHEVNVVVSLASLASISVGFEKFHDAGVPIIISNLGEQFLSANESKIPEGTVVSYNYWKDSYALGLYAGSHFDKGIIIGSIFEIGYVFSAMFQNAFYQKQDKGHIYTFTTGFDVINDDEINKVLEMIRQIQPQFIYTLLDDESLDRLLSFIGLDEFPDLQFITLSNSAQKLSIEHERKVVGTLGSVTLEEQFERLGELSAIELMNYHEHKCFEKSDHDNIEVRPLSSFNSDLKRKVIDFVEDQSGVQYEFDLAEDSSFNKLLTETSSTWMNLYPFPS